MTLNRLYLGGDNGKSWERFDRARVAQVVARFFQGFTMYPVTGYWA